jgi:phosphohistidine phosphatase SixA
VSAILLRHASAGDRLEWRGDDTQRPLDERGRAQAKALRKELLARGVTRVVSSPYLRCTETVGPLASALGVEVEVDDRLAEGAGPYGARDLLASGDGCVACTHGDIVYELIGRMLNKGAAAVVEVEDGGVRVLETIKAPKRRR